MAGRNKDDFGQAKVLTAVIENVSDQLDKLYWNLRQYRAVVRASEGIGTSVGFAALDYAKTATALQNWISKRYDRARAQALVQPVLGTKSIEEMGHRIRWQNPLRSIANTAKHGTFNDALWPGGLAQIKLHHPGALPYAGPHQDQLSMAAHWGKSLKALEDGEAHWELELCSPAKESAIGSEAFVENYIDWEHLVTELGL